MKQKEKLQRIYPGIRVDQKEFIKSEAKKRKLGEGEFIRAIIDFFISRSN